MISSPTPFTPAGRRNNRPNRPKSLLLLAIGTMYAATALFVGTNMYTSALFLKLQKITAQNLDSAFSCVFSLGLTSSEEDIYSCAMAHYIEAPPAVQFNMKAECASTAALTVNVCGPNLGSGPRRITSAAD